MLARSFKKNTNNNMVIILYHYLHIIIKFNFYKPIKENIS